MNGGLSMLVGSGALVIGSTISFNCVANSYMFRNVGSREKSAELNSTGSESETICENGKGNITLY